MKKLLPLLLLVIFISVSCDNTSKDVKTSDSLRIYTNIELSDFDTESSARSADSNKIIGAIYGFHGNYSQMETMNEFMNMYPEDMKITDKNGFYIVRLDGILNFGDWDANAVIFAPDIIQEVFKTKGGDTIVGDGSNNNATSGNPIIWYLQCYLNLIEDGSAFDAQKSLEFTKLLLEQKGKDLPIPKLEDTVEIPDYLKLM